MGAAFRSEGCSRAIAHWSWFDKVSSDCGRLRALQTRRRPDRDRSRDGFEKFSLLRGALTTARSGRHSRRPMHQPVFRRPFSHRGDSRPCERKSAGALADQHEGRLDSPSERRSFREPTDLAAILFTSGSTGAPKGVCYEHGMFDAQVRLIRDTYGIQPGRNRSADAADLRALQSGARHDDHRPRDRPRRPAEVDPAKIVQAIRQEKVTNSFGSPTLWNKIADHCIQHGTTLPSLKRVLCAGAPVPATLWENSGPVSHSGPAAQPLRRHRSTCRSPGVSRTRIISRCPDPANAQAETRHDLRQPRTGNCETPRSRRSVPASDDRSRNPGENHRISDAPIASLAAARELPSVKSAKSLCAAPS